MVFVNVYYNVGLAIHAIGGEVVVDVLPPQSPAPQLHPYDLRLKHAEFYRATGHTGPAKNSPPNPKSDTDSNGQQSEQSKPPPKRQRKRPSKAKRMATTHATHRTIPSYCTRGIVTATCSNHMKTARYTLSEAIELRCQQYFDQEPHCDAVACINAFLSSQGEDTRERLELSPHNVAIPHPIVVSQKWEEQEEHLSHTLPIGNTGLYLVDIPEACWPVMHEICKAQGYTHPHQLTMPQVEYIFRTEVPDSEDDSDPETNSKGHCLCEDVEDGQHSDVINQLPTSHGLSPKGYH
eukprot:TRINITY_DN67970_c6_g10_i1.p1 TRINITY_DN67970_c6_g10~~TRINITY_DN67970_c6_g10_i1.p1  ORF type:complete len:293 (-),score=17.11 TRINITY_DN67970_c6_g10_i1:171-1049(-)